MAKFKCVKSTSYGEHSPKVGDVIEGELTQVQLNYGTVTRIIISKVGDRKDANGIPYWDVGESIPPKGAVWTWEEVK